LIQNKNNNTYTQRRRRLRKNQTDAEAKLWSRLRNRGLDGVKFRRQHSVGNYILDFYAPVHKLCIEADGGQHYEKEGMRKDMLRTEILSKQGIKVLRFSDLEILKNINGVCESIVNEIRRG
jgi:very-short-patch-repair endonuclease